MPQRHNPQDSHKPLARDARLPKNHRPPAGPRSLASVRGSAATKQKRMGGEARVGRLAGALDPPRPGRRGRRGGCCGGGARGASRDTEPRQKNRRQTQGMGQGRGEGGRGGEAARARSHETTHCSFCCCCCCPYPPPPPPSGGGLAPARRLGCGSTTSMIFRASPVRVRYLSALVVAECDATPPCRRSERGTEPLAPAPASRVAPAAAAPPPNSNFPVIIRSDERAKRV
mmetsp:Transcript_28898/g.90394  ORF Transcript_28898/g.90394 Transcript_28898/m.90394 type:complete len:229 (+) Transcript_28898:53-739(+)